MKIGIVSAMPSELDYMFEQLSCKETSIKKNKFFLANYYDHELIIVATGVGKVNAATYTQILIDTFNPDCMINVGIAGGLSETLKPFDIVVGNTYSHHDVDIKQMKNLFPYTYQFKADSELLAAFKRQKAIYSIGTIVSGEKFISNNKERTIIMDTFNAIAVDMETSAMAHACFINDIPFISIRSISDLANDEANLSYKENEKLASQCVDKVLLSFLKEYQT